MNSRFRLHCALAPSLWPSLFYMPTSIGCCMTWHCSFSSDRQHVSAYLLVVLCIVSADRPSQVYVKSEHSF